MGALTAGTLNGEIDDFVYAISETVSNAVQHGRPPVRLRLWAGPDRNRDDDPGIDPPGLPPGGRAPVPGGEPER